MQLQVPFRFWGERVAFVSILHHARWQQPASGNDSNGYGSNNSPNLVNLIILGCSVL
jgi:hypothetical protein